MPAHFRSWTLFVHERQTTRGLSGLPQTRMKMSLIGIAGTGQGGWQAVVEVHPAAAVPPGPQVSAHRCLAGAQQQRRAEGLAGWS